MLQKGNRRAVKMKHLNKFPKLADASYWLAAWRREYSLLAGYFHGFGNN